MMMQMIDSVKYLHKNQILHRNINLNSFLISENPESHEIIIKLTDFTHAAALQNHDKFNESQLENDHIYFPPYNSIQDNHKQDF